MSRLALHAIMRRMITRGALTLRYPDGSECLYRGDLPGPEGGMALANPRAVRRMVVNPALALGELYMDGDVLPMEGGIHALLDTLVTNLWSGGPHPMEQLFAAARQVKRHIDQINPAGRARRNVAHHYDLNGRLYALFLDRDRQYSCAYWARGGEETLEEAQAAKKRHIAAKLRLDRPGLEVLDIGCGWGGMAISLARDWGARVTGITLSEEQLAEARRRAAEAGLADRVRFLLMDYRAWDRPVDRVVSIGMFEHVGLAQYRRFFRAVHDMLRPDGVALIHAIGRSSGPGATNPWLARYIFPGGYSPALSEVLPAVEKAGLWVTDVEVLRLHYGLTLREWRRRFAANRDAIAALYDARFCRMFEFYLSGCELAFTRTDHMNWQMQLTRDAAALPLTRDYMVDTERAAMAGGRIAA